ncbi:MAG: heavy-metal-associated domain-containing protein [Bacteroidia bacterium]|jgi:hypothetical protein
MKKFLFIAFVSTILMAFAFPVPPVKTTFKVSGNCGMCKERIEVALDQKGVKSAEWNIDSKVLEVIYVPEKVTIEQIHHYVASVGHDTDKELAPDSIYKQLPDCCQYREHPNTHHD